MNYIFSLLITLFLLGSFQSVKAQADRDYILAVQWIRMQEYEKAKALMEDLVKKQPANQNYLQQLLICYVQTKEYEKGKEAILKAPESVRNSFPIQNEWANLHHLSGEQEKAYLIWDDVLAKQSGNMSVYQVVASTMMERREFSRAASVYKMARTQLKNAFLYLNELANAYLQASQYREAAEELLLILQSSPNRLDMVQRQFSRYNDEFLYDEAIISLEEKGLERPKADENLAMAQRELLLWLYMERGLERKAVRWAVVLEQNFPADYYVYNVAQNLARRESFELAEQAYDFYVKNPKTSPKLLVIAQEAKADLYLRWASTLEEKGLNVFGKPDSLYRLATGLLEKVLAQAPDYENRTRVFIKVIDMNLERLSNQAQARKWYVQLQREKGTDLQDDEKAYLQGRFAMLDGDFRKARIELTRANRSSSNADMLEKSRYYLALTDFYAGDFEFAKIQLKSVERQKTSFYSNDAVKLRNWIRKGIQKDSVMPELVTFSKAMYALSRHEFKAVEQILTTAFDSLGHLQADAALVLSEVNRKTEPLRSYQWLGTFKGIKTQENLFFERIALGFILIQRKNPAVLFSEMETEIKEFITLYPGSIHAETIRLFLKQLEDIES